MTLDSNVQNVVIDIATNAKAMKTLINGNAADLSELTTTQKSSLVAAINEVAAAVGGAGATIDDGAPSTLTVWSSAKTDTEVKAAVAAIVDGAPEALDTLRELAQALDDDPNFVTTILEQIGQKADIAHTHAAGDIVSGTIDAARLPSATEAAPGIAELATTAETVTGTDTARVVTPAGVKAVADTKAALSHVHAAGDITTGTFAPARLPQANIANIGALATASNGEVQAGTLATKAVTPASLYFVTGPTDTDYVSIFRARLV